jgi:hypothetical protein
LQWLSPCAETVTVNRAAKIRTRLGSKTFIKNNIISKKRDLNLRLITTVYMKLVTLKNSV